MLPIRTQGCLTILAYTIDLAPVQVAQPISTRATLTRATTILGYQRVSDELLALDVPLNRSFRRQLQLPPSNPNALLYIGAPEGGLGLPRLSDQINLRIWSMTGRLQERGGLSALAIGGLLSRAAEVSGGQFLQQGQGDFIGPYPTTLVWGGSLGALGVDTSLRLSPTLGPPSHPLLLPLALGLPRLDNGQLLRTLRRLEVSTWADSKLIQAHADSKLIPPHLTQHRWDAFTFPLHNLDLQRDLHSALLIPPTLEELKAAILHHKGSTAPGATGLTYNMVKTWPDSVVTKAHELLTLAFSGPTPTWLQWGWLCPKPKDPENGITLDGLRPLMLLEVLKKLWVWIHIRKIVCFWETHQVLTLERTQPSWSTSIDLNTQD